MTVEPEYEERAYEEKCWIDTVFRHGKDWLEDLRQKHGSDFPEYLEMVQPPLEADCINRILHGGVLEASEAQMILDFVVEDDPDRWCSLIVWEAPCMDGTVFIACLGLSAGQGGIELQLAGMYPTRAEAAAACAYELVAERIIIPPPVALRASWGNEDSYATLEVSGALWSCIQGGETHFETGLGFHNESQFRAFWYFKDGKVKIEDVEDISYVTDLPVADLHVTSASAIEANA
ncbi:MAG: hypothetical protein K9G71_16740 [Rhodobacteraceae bacterium]|nr:hypothetical protein [Paracoccaceae bacterium]MCF8515916.1 hypothetical protein [Paracoccaceae bacterium]